MRGCLVVVRPPLTASPRFGGVSFFLLPLALRSLSLPRPPPMMTDRSYGRHYGPQHPAQRSGLLVHSPAHGSRSAPFKRPLCSNSTASHVIRHHSSYSATQPLPRWMINSVASSRWHILQLIPSRKNGVFAWDWTLWLACFVCRRDYGLCGC